MHRKKTFEEVKEIIESFGYELIDKIYISNKHKLVVKDNYNYLYYANINNIMSGSKLETFHKNNPFSINNIKTWLKLNNKNFEIISTVFPNATDKILWKCLNDKCNEIFDSSWNCIHSQKHACPYCSSHRVSNLNNLHFLYPEIAKEWHPTKNGEITPYNITAHSARKIWWLCKINSNHEWKTALNNRVHNKTKCPYCSGRLASRENNLLIDNPKLCSEWDYNKNKKTPENYTPFSSYKASWICSKCDNKWNAAISERNRKERERGCPKCNQSKGENRIEQWLVDNNLYFDIQYKFNDCINISYLLFDFAIFDDKDKTKLKMLIEYDGEFHYQVARYSKDKEKMLRKLKSQQKNDNIKNEYCKNNNIRLLRIPYWEYDNIEEILKSGITNIM